MAWEGDADLLAHAKAGADAMKTALGEYGEGAVAYGNAGKSTPSCCRDRVLRRFAASDHGESDAVTKLFGDNYPRLQRLKAKYDPTCVFGGWFPIMLAVQ